MSIEFEKKKRKIISNVEIIPLIKFNGENQYEKGVI